MGRCGIEARFTGRNDITAAEGRKFSGNAFRFVKDKGLMHGTILIDTDSNKMSRYLNVSKAKMDAKGVNSVRSRIVNLIELVPDITPACISDSLKESFRAEYGAFDKEITFSSDTMSSEIAAIYNKYSSWQWRFGETPEFNISFESRFTWGGIEVFISAEKGIIQDINIYTDAMDASLAEILKDSLTKCRLSMNDIKLKIQSAAALLASSGSMLADPSVLVCDLCRAFEEIL